MLFAVTMHVDLPHDLDQARRAELVAREREYCQHLQRRGKWRSIWRIVGRYSNLSIFEVDDNAELNDILWKLPLFDYMRIEVTPLTTHPSAVPFDA